jgi:hypothetical protein
MTTPPSSVGMSPPHARGWPVEKGEPLGIAGVSPARAGMARLRAGASGRAARLPRTRGDDPMKHVMHDEAIGVPPRRRGWPVRMGPGGRTRHLSPACAGMHRATSSTATRWAPLPRARGWPGDGRRLQGVLPLFPARAGMARPDGRTNRACIPLPRARGDGPRLLPQTRKRSSSPPRMRGCSDPGRRHRTEVLSRLVLTVTSHLPMSQFVSGHA